MKILLVGANGIIGQAISNALETHQVIRVGHHHGELKVDIEDQTSIRALFEQVGQVDAIISAAGNGSMGSLKTTTDAGYATVLNNKVMGQVNLVRIGAEYLSDNGSITLTSGQSSQNPMPGSLAIGMGCAAIEAFVRSAALELERGQRINVVSPGFVKETMEQLQMDSTHGVPAHSVAKVYRNSIVGGMNGMLLPAVA